MFFDFLKQNLFKVKKAKKQIKICFETGKFVQILRDIIDAIYFYLVENISYYRTYRYEFFFFR